MPQMWCRFNTVEDVRDRSLFQPAGNDGGHAAGSGNFSCIDFGRHAAVPIPLADFAAIRSIPA